MTGNNLIEQKTTQMQAAGSFWYSRFSGKDLATVRSLVRSPDISSIWNIDSDSCFEYQDSAYSPFYDRYVSVESVEVTNGNPNSRKYVGKFIKKPRPFVDEFSSSNYLTYPDPNYGAMLSDDLDLFLFPISSGQTWEDYNSRSVLYVVSLSEEGVFPSVIRKGNKILTQGVGFTQIGSQLIFLEDPNDLVVKGEIFVSSGEEYTKNPFSYVHAVDKSKGRCEYVSHFLKGKHSAYVLERALNEIAGYPVVYNDFVVKDIYVNRNGCTCILGEQGEFYEVPSLGLDVDASAGKKLNKGTILKKVINCNTFNAQGRNWYGNVLAKPTLKLLVSSIGNDVYIPSGPVKITRTTSTFCSISALGTTNDVTTWNSLRSTQESAYGYNISSKLISVTGLGIGDSLSVDLLSLLFSEGGINFKNGLVISVDKTKIENTLLSSVLSFIDRNKPTNMVTLIN